MRPLSAVSPRLMQTPSDLPALGSSQPLLGSIFSFPSLFSSAAGWQHAGSVQGWMHGWMLLPPSTTTVTDPPRSGLRAGNK